MKLGTVYLGFSVVAGFLGGLISSSFVDGLPLYAENGSGKTVVAERFSLVDSKGTMRGLWAYDDKVRATALTLLRADGETRSTELMTLPSGKAGLSFYDATGKRIARLSNERLIVSDGRREQKVFVKPSGVGLLDENDTVLWKAP